MSYSFNFNITPSAEDSSRPYSVTVKQQKVKEEPVKLYVSPNPYDEPIICKPAKKAGEKAPIIKRFGSKSWKALKKLRPSHIFAMTMFGMMCFVRMGGSASSPQTSAPKSVSAAIANAYEQGAQHVRDSIRVAQLEQENKLLADSLKQLKKLPK
ncbi:MAG: hypothetical protein K6E29_06255 [Cyanobacteria bacterium RUI128]|nr:hypothetical protein [Cyanobacteria bacterium RUI128]